MSQKEIVNFYFQRKPDTNSYEFRCGKVRKQEGTRGHENLMEHLTRDHKDFLDELHREKINTFSAFHAAEKPKQFTIG